MHKPRIYIDTSVIGGCFDEEFQEWSNKLFDLFVSGKLIAMISDVTTTEIEPAPDYVKNKIKEIPKNLVEYIDKNDEAESLASKYIEHHAISIKYQEDALHIAMATVNKADVLVSWNFKHIVNLRRIHIYNSINLMLDYQPLEIRTPREVIDND
ncbi:MAG: type II toxin-antitoxin system VapC family toxin [Bacteroidetes bacterium]|nr:type II toxin-antitoxin system VapC family toxin [Bacteroidota bacterium]